MVGRPRHNRGQAASFGDSAGVLKWIASQFWKIIEVSRKKAKGDLDAQIDALREQLQELPPDEVVAFQEFLDENWERRLPLGSVGCGLHHRRRVFRRRLYGFPRLADLEGRESL